MINRVLDSIKVEGAKGLSATIKAAQAVETTPAHPDGQVTIQTTAAHGFVVGSHLYIEGTTNYDGVHEVLATPTTDKITIRAKFVAELFVAQTIKVAIVPNARFVFVGFSIKMDAAPTQSESFTITLDSNDGQNFDVLVFSRNWSTLSDTDFIWTTPEDELIPFEKDDILRVAWTNTNTKTYGLKLWFRRLQ